MTTITMTPILTFFLCCLASIFLHDVSRRVVDAFEWMFQRGKFKERRLGAIKDIAAYVIAFCVFGPFFVGACVLFSILIHTWPVQVATAFALFNVIIVSFFIGARF